MTHAKLIARLSNLEGPDREIEKHENYIRELSKGTVYGLRADTEAISYHERCIAVLKAKETTHGE